MDDSIPQEMTIETPTKPLPRDTASVKQRRTAQVKKHATIVDLGLKDVPLVDIAKIVDMKPATVRSIMNRFSSVFQDIDHVDEYRQNKADIIDALQLVALRTAFSEAKLKKAGFSALIAGVKELNNISRLENNQSTSNLAVSFGQVGLTQDE